MKKIILAVSLFFLSSLVSAWTIGPMNYQGRLLDNAGIPVTGAYNFTVRIYDAANGGTLKFSEQHNSIAVDDGVYSFLVSNGTSPTGTWDINLWNTPQLYLEVVVNGETLTPRHLLASTPFAFQANLALTTNNALALGGKSAGNILQDICKAGKGKWLELANQCLGVGASFPGPTMVALNTLTASTDLSNLDLTNADISGINFGTANFTGTLFKGTTMNGAGVGNANMTNTKWDAVVVTGTKIFNNIFAGAKIGNTDMSGWDLSGALLSGSSMAHLLACPSSLPVTPAPYRCRGENGDRIILGPSINLSSDSLMAGQVNRDSDPFNFMFNNAVSGNVATPINLSGVSFAGNDVNDIMIDTVDLSNTNFSGATIRNVYFTYNNFSGSNFNQGSITASRFMGTQASGGANFAATQLNSVEFYPGAIGTSSSFNFGDGFLLDSVVFKGGGTAQGSLVLEFSTGTWKSVVFDATITYLNAIGIVVHGGLYVGQNVSPLAFEGMTFVNGNISGKYNDSAFYSNVFTNVSFYGANLTGATMTDSIFNNVNWYGATCPDGYSVNTLGGTCIGHGAN